MVLLPLVELVLLERMKLLLGPELRLEHPLLVAELLIEMRWMMKLLRCLLRLLHGLIALHVALGVKAQRFALLDSRLLMRRFLCKIKVAVFLQSSLSVITHHFARDGESLVVEAVLFLDGPAVLRAIPVLCFHQLVEAGVVCRFKCVIHIRNAVRCVTANGRSVPLHMSQNETKQGFVESVVMSIFEPGVNSNVVIVMNVALVLLLCVLGVLAVMTRNIHVYALILIALGLFFSIQWYLSFFFRFILKVLG